MSCDLPFFSIVIPTYERPAQLLLCLQALARLDYPFDKFEVVVVDDGSANSPVQVLEELGDSLRTKLVLQKNQGPAAARNLGSLNARGEFLAFTDDDCQPDRRWLRELASVFLATPDRIIGGRTINALPANACSATSQAILDVVYAHFNDDPNEAHFFASNNFAVPARLFQEAGGFDETFTTSEDREFCDRWRTLGFRLSYAREAVVSHAHDLNLLTLWQQHLGYGRGAQRFHHARSLQGQGRFKPDTSFYLKLLRAAASHADALRPVQMVLLLFLSQLANAVGFFAEKFVPRRGKTQRMISAKPVLSG